MPHDSVGEFLETLRHCHPEILESQDDWASTFEKSNFIALCDLDLYRLSVSIKRHSNGSAAQQPAGDRAAVRKDDQGTLLTQLGLSLYCVSGEDSIQTSILLLHQHADQCSLGSPAGDAPSSPIAYSSLDSDQLRAVSIPVPVPIAVHASTHDATSSLNAKPY